MKVDAMRRMVKRWEDVQRKTTGVSGQDSKTAKVIRESHWNVRHEYDTNYAKKDLDHSDPELPTEERQLLYGLETRYRNWFNHVLHQPIVPAEKIKM
jgi:hypothetical protein